MPTTARGVSLNTGKAWEEGGEGQSGRCYLALSAPEGEVGDDGERADANANGLCRRGDRLRHGGPRDARGAWSSTW
jgi:hypothetical protein